MIIQYNQENKYSRLQILGDQVTVGGRVVTSLQIKSECDAVGKVDDNEVVGKTNPIISANSDTSACTYSSKGSGSYISVPASLQLDADTNKNENDSPLEEITTVTFPLCSVSPIFTIGCKGNPDNYSSNSHYRCSSSSSSTDYCHRRYNSALQKFSSASTVS